MVDEQIFKKQNVNDNEFVLLFLYNKYIKIHLAITDTDVAVYGNIFNSSLFILFILVNKSINIYIIYIKYLKIKK